MFRPVAVVLVFGFTLVVAACTSSTEPTTTLDLPSPIDTTTTTAPPPDATTSTTIGTVEIPGTASESLDPGVVDQMREELAALMVQAEEVRGLPFLSVPTVVILDEAEFTERVGAIFAEELDEADMAIDSRYYSLIGMLPEGTDLYSLFVELFKEGVVGFYDLDETEMVVPAAQDGFTPLQRMAVVHELVHALTDQHFEFGDSLTTVDDEGNGDDSSAMRAVGEGDAQRASFVYLESLSPADAVAAVTEALLIDSTVFNAAPAWIQSDLLFPYEQGLTFTSAVIGDGGLAAVDAAYVDPPSTTEQILNYDKYVVREGTRNLAPITAELVGWEIHDEGSFGEWGLRLVLGESIPRGDATQAAAGWGNDDYRVFSRGDDVAFVMSYIGDAERDAEELADALIAHIGTSMAGGPAVESGGGLLYDQAEIYVFLDRVDDQVFWIASTNKAAGADLRSQLGL